MSLETNLEKSNCVSCGQPLSGPYCAQCGEKIIDPDKDFSLLKFIEQTVDGFTHLDSKLLKSFGLLIAKPGLLTLEYITGRRNRYMKPLQVFLISSLIFYFVFPHSSAYFNDVAEMNHGYLTNNRFENTFHYNFLEQLKARAAIDSLSLDGALHNFRAAASDNAKKFFFLLAPVFAFFLFLLYRRSYKQYIPHVIFAMHSLSFFLLLDLFYIKTLSLAGFHAIGDWLILPLVLLYGIHLFVSLKYVYKNTLAITILKFIAVLFLFLLAIMLYRQLITIYTLQAM